MRCRPSRRCHRRPAGSAESPARGGGRGPQCARRGPGRTGAWRRHEGEPMSQAPATTSGLVRVTVASGTRRVDLVLPGAIPVAELLPELARSVGLLDAATVYGGYRLVTSEGRRLASDSGLTLQGVEDGSVITVTAGADPPPSPVYDDVVEAMTDVVEHDLKPWEPAAGRRTALGAAAILMALGAVALLLQREATARRRRRGRRRRGAARRRDRALPRAGGAGGGRDGRLDVGGVRRGGRADARAGRPRALRLRRALRRARGPRSRASSAWSVSGWDARSSCRPSWSAPSSAAAGWSSTTPTPTPAC